MIRAVFDTNVVVSGFLWSGAPSRAMDAAIDGRFTLLATEALLTELTTVLSRSKFQRRFDQLGKSVDDFIANYRALVDLVEPAVIQPTILADPTDDAVLACAGAGKADYIVSGDNKHLLAVGEFDAIPILTVSSFLERLHSPGD
ncbi:MAG: putative toxin-antitoxin system toxin component, PIN family [Anaerolineae bacterium]|nr:putative toxin-antitoxin system toxin component, PIN family [Anaerolineae bacterium]